MTDAFRIRALWSGMPGTPGVSTFYLNAAPSGANLTAIKDFFAALNTGLPNTLSVAVQGTGDIVNAEAGTLIGTWTTTTPAVAVGTAASGYAAPVGTLVHWLTGGVINGHHVKGTTFIVPTVNQYEPGGTPVGTWLTTLSNAAGSLRDALTGLFVVWARPFTPIPPASEPPERSGSLHLVSSTRVPDKAVVLRSRRD